MSKIRLLTFLSIVVVVFLFSFDTYAAAGDSLTDAIKIEDGQEYSQTRGKTVYYEYISSEASEYSVSFKVINGNGGLYDYESIFFINGDRYDFAYGRGGIITDKYLNPGDKLTVGIKIEDTSFESYDLECSIIKLEDDGVIKLEDGQEYSQTKGEIVHYEYISSEASGYRITLKNKVRGGFLEGYNYDFYLNGDSYRNGYGYGYPEEEIYLKPGEKFSIDLNVYDKASQSYDLVCSIEKIDDNDILKVFGSQIIIRESEGGTYKYEKPIDTWDAENRILYLQDLTIMRINIEAIYNAPNINVEINIKGNNILTGTASFPFKSENVNLTFTGDGILDLKYDPERSKYINCHNGNCVIDGPTIIIETDVEPIHINGHAYGYDPKEKAAYNPKCLEDTYSFTLKSGTIDVTLRESIQYNYVTGDREHMYPYAVIAANGNVDISGGVIKVRFVEDTEGNNPAPMTSVIESDYKDINLSNVIIAVDGNDKLNIPIAKAHVGNENIDSSVKTVDYYDYVSLSKEDFTLEYSETLETGKEIKPLVKNTASLVEGTDYKVEYKDNIKIGEATVSIVGIGKCIGEVTLKFTIKENPNKTKPTATPTPEVSPSPDVSAVPSVSPTPSGPPVRDKSDISPENPAKISDVEKTILNKKDEKDSIGSTFTLLKAKGTPKSKKSIKLSWAKVPGAEKYMIFGNKCGKKNKYKYITTVTGTSYTAKKLKKGTYYKYTIVAVRGDEAIATSKTIHVATDGGKKGNNTKVKLSKTKLTLKIGKSKTVKAKLKSKKKVSIHRKVAWESDNLSVAKVDKKGKITAVGKGTCYIYAYAQNGVASKIKVTVK